MTIDNKTLEAELKEWLVARVFTGSDDKIAERVGTLFPNSEIVPFVPKKAFPKRVKRYNDKGDRVSNIVKFVEGICFPGYMFLEVPKPAKPTEFAEGFADICSKVTKVEGVYHFLSYGMDNTQRAIKPHGCDFLRKMMDKNYCIDYSEGYKEGDKIVIISSPLVGLESHIKKITGRQHTVTIEMEMMGDIRKLDLAINMIKKT